MERNKTGAPNGQEILDDGEMKKNVLLNLPFAAFSSSSTTSKANSWATSKGTGFP
jgi:hypothetical protein